MSSLHFSIPTDLNTFSMETVLILYALTHRILFRKEDNDPVNSKTKGFTVDSAKILIGFNFLSRIKILVAVVVVVVVVIIIIIIIIIIVIIIIVLAGDNSSFILLKIPQNYGSRIWF